MEAATSIGPGQDASEGHMSRFVKREAGLAELRPMEQRPTKRPTEKYVVFILTSFGIVDVVEEECFGSNLLLDAVSLARLLGGVFLYSSVDSTFWKKSASPLACCPSKYCPCGFVL